MFALSRFWNAPRSITAKLTRIYLVVAISALLSAGLISQFVLHQQARATAHANLRTQCEAMAGNLESAVSFFDTAFAAQTLAALQHFPEVRMAELVMPDGTILARYGDDLGAARQQLVTMHDFMETKLHGVTQEISPPGSPRAQLLLVASLKRINLEALRTSGLWLILSAVIVFASYETFRRLCGNVTHPIEKLTAVMRRVEQDGDFELRAAVVSDDETGELSKGFNAMLSTIARQNKQLNTELEQRKQIERQILATKNKLQATLDTIPDLMFEVGIDGCIYDYHSPQTESLAADPEFFLSRPLSEVLPNDAAEVCHAALREANESGHSIGRQYRLSLPQGERWFELSVARREMAMGNELRFIALARDITERKVAEDQIRNLAFYDALTKLPNRRLLLDHLKRALSSCKRNGRYGAVLFIDLDNFKTLNDTLGHDFGDLLLQQVAQRLVGCVREGDTVARLGGDEFVVMLEDLSDNVHEAAKQAKLVGEKILASLNQTYELASVEYHNTPSIGVTLLSDSRGGLDDFLKQADLAMYQAKAAGRNGLRFFDPEMQAEAFARAELDADLHLALKEQQFLLYYQPQVDGNGRLTGAEALLRWQHPQRGLLAPAEFILLAEETRLIVPLGFWVLREACAQLAKWATRPETAQLTIAVNVSAHQFHHVDFVDQVLSALVSSGANPHLLTLELTESLLVSDLDNIAVKMFTLKNKGVSFSLNDFGTGYSSLAYLKSLPLDQLKIDKSFVHDVLSDPSDASIAKTIIVLANNLGLSVIAEGVETAAQKEFLSLHGCHDYQGFLFSRPIPIEDFNQLASKGTGDAVVASAGKINLTGLTAS